MTPPLPMTRYQVVWVISIVLQVPGPLGVNVSLSSIVASRVEPVTSPSVASMLRALAMLSLPGGAAYADGASTTAASSALAAASTRAVRERRDLAGWAVMLLRTSRA